MLYRILICILAFSACTSAPPNYKMEIQEAMDSQQKAWNDGDIRGFMSYYRDSEQLRFVTSKGMVKGHASVLDRYLKSYPDRETMGQLEFELLDVEPLGDDFVLTIGKWTLRRSNDQPSGYFSLIWHKEPQGWKIIHDHTG